ncbi:MAG: nucleotidyltransferase domain-containing protein [Nanoarchaeota archaeon]|nr:nucleotidyltransferase domain-containing protein [Nanoarchaeota archaeon]MBU1988296.1 nucleotidyltransferase domain-containing protein [Nanoarchaeota archaeon]
MKLKKLNFSIGKKEFNELKKETNNFIDVLKRHVGKNRVNADVFLGGSFAKGTLAKAEEYDADIFVRFDWKYEDLSAQLEKILKGVVKELGLKIKKIHGSRDYFKVWKNKMLTFEVIPVLRIKKVQEARNVTDLSYFHVNCVKRHLKGKMKEQLALAKKFFKANGIYGAESYIHGFSGYGLECLIIHYKSFEKLLKELIKVKDKRVVIDSAKHYRKKDNVFFELNESKLHSPIILVDPTWKERNVLASLNWETFRKFQDTARNFIKNPSEKFFYGRKVDIENLKKKGEFLHIILETNRQEGDIAGTKMKKFSGFLVREIEKYFNILEREFFYQGEGQKADVYLVLKSRGEVIRIGPPLKMEKDVKRFRARNKKTFVKNGVLHARVKIDFFGRVFVKKWARSKEGKMKMGGMGVVGLKVAEEL